MTIYGSILAVVVVVSALFGLAVGAGVLRSISIGLYLGGAALLVGCFVTGARGPLRGVSKTGEVVPVVGASRVRRATGEERLDASKTSILLFFLGLGLVILGALIDPAHKTF
ncbi:MAG TPA: hypothetical protein VFB25_02330 [Gaiellaceae bacterium]|nr:hypothetical protein [Gaiellaceae bacterium]